MKRAFNASFWKHAVLFVLLFSGWWWMYAGLAARAGMMCGPPPSQTRPGHEHHDLGKPWQEQPLQWKDSKLDKPEGTSPCSFPKTREASEWVCPFQPVLRQTSIFPLSWQDSGGTELI